MLMKRAARNEPQKMKFFDGLGKESVAKGFEIKRKGVARIRKRTAICRRQAGT